MINCNPCNLNSNKCHQSQAATASVKLVLTRPKGLLDPPNRYSESYIQNKFKDMA